MKIYFSTKTKLQSVIFSCTLCIVSSFSSIPTAIAEGQSGMMVVAKYDGQKSPPTSKDLRPIFMGGNLSRQYSAVHLPAGHPLRLSFNTKIIGLTEARIQSYWAQLKFTGRGNPPIELKTVDAILEYIRTHDNVAAYLPKDILVPSGLVIIYP